MRAAWWWIDRWRKSSAYRDFTPEQKGMYRDLLDEVWLREGGVIPDDDRVLGLIVGDPKRWKKQREIILKRFIKVDENGWTHKTALEVKVEAQDFVERQRSKGKTRAEKASRGPAGCFQPDQPEASRTSSRRVQPESSLPSPSPSITYKGIRLHDRDDHGLPTSQPATSQPNNPPANPFIPRGGRPALEAEVLRLVVRLSELTGKDPVEIMACSASYEGDRGRTKLNPANMTDDRLLHTLRDLRADVSAAEAKHGT